MMVWFVLLLIQVHLVYPQPLNLEGVPENIKAKILKFHQVLETPDNFSALETTTASVRFRLAGLQEVGEGESRDDLEPGARTELQQDLFRFSERLSTPPDTGSNIYSRILNTKERRKKRLEKEWKKFLKWRKKQKKRKRMRKRIMKMLKRKIEKRFGPLSKQRWKKIQQNNIFKDKKNVIKQKIRERLNGKRKRKKLRRKNVRKNKDRLRVREG